jgi:hypothetical protein
MIRSAWFPLFVGAALALSCAWLLNAGAILETVGLPVGLGGALLMADGVFGLRIFPLFLSTARRPEEESLPEQMLYSFDLTRVRYGLILVFIVAAMGGLEQFGKADWLLWAFLGSLAVHLILLLFHARQAIISAGDYLAENDR